MKSMTTNSTHHRIFFSYLKMLIESTTQIFFWRETIKLHWLGRSFTVLQIWLWAPHDPSNIESNHTVILSARRLPGDLIGVSFKWAFLILTQLGPSHRGLDPMSSIICLHECQRLLNYVIFDPTGPSACKQIQRMRLSCGDHWQNQGVGHLI